jgi:hypothetical protein
MDFIRTILRLSRKRNTYIADPEKKSAFLESIREIESRYFAAFYDFDDNELEFEPGPIIPTDELSLSLVPDEEL